tara:strand:+ start:230 stop:814 length:585 start_codon:yes stop_codon:yes gene_type:complete
MNKIIILLLTASLLISLDIDIPRFSKEEPIKDLKAYGTIEFGDSKKFIQTKFKENEIYRNNNTGAYIINLFDTPFEITFLYGTSDRKPSFLRAIRLNLFSIIDSHIVSQVIDAFNSQYGAAEKYYINIQGDLKEYFKWEKDEKEIHLDFDGININITINSKHFNKLSQDSIKKTIKGDSNKKESRQNKQLEKLF